MKTPTNDSVVANLGTHKGGVASTLKETSQPERASYIGNIWLWVALIEALIIVFLLLKRRHPRERSGLQGDLQQAKDGKIDFMNLHRSFYHAKDLHDKLIRECHPDRFPEAEQPELHRWAEEVSLQVRESWSDYACLLELKTEIETKLGKTINMNC